MNCVTNPPVRILFACFTVFLLMLQFGCGRECTIIEQKCVPCDAAPGGPETGLCCSAIVKTIPCPGGQLQGGLTDNFAGALVFEKTDVVRNFDVSVDGMPVLLNSNVGEFQRPLIIERLIAQGVFNPQTQNILFFQTSNPISVSLTSVITASFTLARLNGSPLLNGRIGFGVTSLSFLKPGITPDQFFAFSEVVSPDNVQNVPTLSEWGFILMSLLLMTAGTVFIVRRQWAITGVAVISSGIQSDKGMTAPLFVPKVFIKVLAITLAFVLVGVAVVVWLFGTITALDACGIVLCVVILSYLVHLLILTTRDSRQNRI